MDIGYSNNDIDFWLKERTEKYGSQWSIVAAFSSREWEQAAQLVRKSIASKFPLAKKGTKTTLFANGMLALILGKALDEKYPEAKLIQDFINICGHEITPSVSIQALPFNRVAAIFAITRSVLKKHMSPKRNIDT